MMIVLCSCEEGNTVVCNKQHKHVDKNYYCEIGEKNVKRYTGNEQSD